MDILDTVKPKSDQLNADDLLFDPITVRIERVEIKGGDQPVDIYISGGHKPYRPSKSMRRVLISCFGRDKDAWVGQSVTLYRDPSVRFGRDAVGGIKISHATGLTSKASLSLTASRGKKVLHVVEPLYVESVAYPEDMFKQNLPIWRKAIADGKITPQQVISRASSNGELSQKMIRDIMQEIK